MDELDRALDLFIRQVGHWYAPRWAAGAATGELSRADVVHRLVQEIADLAADAESQPRRRVPRLDNDQALPDQLRVVSADLRSTDAPEELLATAATRIADTRRIL